MTNTSTDIISGLEQYADSEGPRIDLNSLYDDGNNEIVLLGVGNILLTDEGLGVHVVKELKESFTFTPAISIIDGGTMGMEAITVSEFFLLCAVPVLIFIPAAFRCMHSPAFKI